MNEGAMTGGGMAGGAMAGGEMAGGGMAGGEMAGGGMAGGGMAGGEMAGDNRIKLAWFRAGSRLSWVRRMTFRARLSSLVALAVGVAVALASLVSYFYVRHELYGQVDSTLTAELGQITSGGTIDLGRGGLEAFLARTGSFLQVNLSNCAVIQPPAIGAPDLPCGSEQEGIADAGGSGTQLWTVSYGGQPYRVIGEAANYGGVAAVVQVARPLSDVDHTLSDMRLILWLVSLAGIGVAVGLGWVVGRTTMRPVERLTEAAEHVAATQDLASRIDVDGDDELARLAIAFNSMLGALAASRQQQAQLISDTGHELRTPLTSLRTNIEVLMRVRDLPDGDREALLSDVRAQLNELTTLVGDVVELARGEEQQAEPIEVRLDDIVVRAVERARRRAPSITFDTHLATGSVKANPALLERAVVNVLDNAAKWSPSGATVDIRLARGDRWILEVHDQGPGIAAEDLPHVFERFYRAASARSMPGSGLGLAIVHQVVTDHEGRVSVASPPGGGTIVRIELPTVIEAEPGWEAVPAAAAEQEPAGEQEPPSAAEQEPPSAGEQGPPSAGEQGPPSAADGDATYPRWPPPPLAHDARESPLAPEPGEPAGRRS